MTRKILLACLILLLSVSSLSAESDFDLSGLWHIYGEGFAEKGFVRVSLELSGNMQLTTQTIEEISPDLKEIISDDLTLKVDPAHDKWLKSDMNALTGYEVYLKLTATQLDIKAGEEYLPNGIKIPVLIPDIRPSVDDPFRLPAVSYDGLKYELIITGVDSGVLNLTGYIDVDTVGECELNTECMVWRDGSSRPSGEGKSSGCNSGWGIFALMLIGVIKFVRN